MHLVDSGTEKNDITLTKVEDPKEKDPDAEHPESGTLVPSYENGVATVATAGTLKSLLGDDYLNSISIGKGLTNIAIDAFGADAIDIYIKDLSAWCNIDRECLYCRDLYLNGEKLEHLIIPEDITEIKTGTFVRCSSLKSVNIGNNVTKIGAVAFGACSSLTTVTIGDSVNEIGERAFHECQSLNSITIGKGCSVIASMAFLDCASDGAVYCYAPTLPSIKDSPFNKNTEKTLYVPGRYLAAYKSSAWADFFDQIKETTDL